MQEALAEVYNGDVATEGFAEFILEIPVMGIENDDAAGVVARGGSREGRPGFFGREGVFEVEKMLDLCAKGRFVG